MDPASFDLVVVGCGGGHDETNLSAYLVKPRDKPWSDGILGLEAGSGYGALKQLLSTHPHLFASLFKSRPHSTIDKAHTVYSHLRAYLISHAHLDHCASLIISSGSLPGPTRHILGTQSVLDDLERCIWRPGRCWPRIVGWDPSSSNTAGGILRALKLAPNTDTLGDRDDEYAPIGAGLDDLLVRVVPLSHGCAYTSSGFFIRHARTRHEFLFFGDVEADPVLPCPPRPLLFPIWTHTAHLFTSNRLRTLLIECSYPAGRPESQLFGHLSVEGLRKEMNVLAGEVIKLRPRVVEIEEGTVKLRTARRPLKRKASSDLAHPRTRSLAKSHTPSLPGPLTGLRVIVTHCKEPPPGFDLQGAPSIADYIVKQLKYGTASLGPDETGVEYVAAHQGDEFGEWKVLFWTGLGYKYVWPHGSAWLERV
ncbi:cAMP phosphodiesterase class-II protein, partial [Rhizoctonia solani AG-3 Rhs1AP]